MGPQVEECNSYQQLEEVKHKLSSGASRGSVTLWTPQVFCFSQLWEYKFLLLQQLWETNVLAIVVGEHRHSFMVEEF